MSALLSHELPACMGGWCRKRGRCERHLTPRRDQVSERLCGSDDERVYRLRAPVLLVNGVQARTAATAAVNFSGHR